MGNRMTSNSSIENADELSNVFNSSYTAASKNMARKYLAEKINLKSTFIRKMQQIRICGWEYAGYKVQNKVKVIYEDNRNLDEINRDLKIYRRDVNDAVLGTNDIVLVLKHYKSGKKLEVLLTDSGDVKYITS
ncbi:Uncharacterised protein [Candidatus Tiddalikarchaeum anstoanum]|nr:Uncharacterised protein [Candidatus Tiddalikarchaeum anstoanum]